MEQLNDNKNNQPTDNITETEQNPYTVPPKIPNRNLKIIIGVLIVLFVASVSVAGFFILKGKNSNDNQKLTENQNTNTPTQNQEITPEPVKITEQDNPIVVKKEKAFVYNSSTKEFKQISPDGYKVLYYGYDTYLPATENIFLLKDNKIFTFDIVNSKVNEASIPALKNEGNVYESINNILLSQDKSKALITIGTYDKTSKEYQNEFAGPQSVSTKEIKYDIQTNKWENSSIIETAKNLVKDNSVWFVKWDSKNNKLFGHRSGEGIGNTAPVYVVDLNKNTFQKTPDYGGEGIHPYFASNLDKFILVDFRNNSLLLFSSNDLSSPQKTIDIKNVFNQHCQHHKSLFKWEVQCDNGIFSIAWSPNEDQIAVGLNTQIYTIDLGSNNVSLKFSDETIGQSYMYWERFTIAYSPSGKYIFFVDYDNTHQEDRGTLLKDENSRFKLTAVDVNSNVVTVLQNLTESFYILAGGY